MTKVRDVNIEWARAELREGNNGIKYITNALPLPEYPRALFDKIDEWAEKTPDAIALADRRAESGWRTLTYAELKQQSRAIGEYLLNKGDTAEHGLAIIAPNSIDHALMALGAMRAGVPYAPIAPAYALLSTDYEKLIYVLGLMAPTMIYVDDSEPYAKALKAAMPQGCQVTAAKNAAQGFSLADAIATTPGAAIDAAEQAVTSDTVAKLLFTSGSTGMPKAVINTQRMLCANQVMIRESLQFFKDKPPVLVDWLPWNHTAGGNHNFGIVLFNGGTLYIDEGKPTPDGIAATITNLSDVSPDIYFNVPKGYELLVHAMDENEQLRNNFFSQLQVMQYSGAGLSPHVLQRLIALSIETTGEEVPIITGFGATETAPFATCPIEPMKEAGTIGLPAKGVEFKLVPHDVKTELRVRAPSVTPGYWREPAKTEEAFDEEGFYCLKDAVKLVDPNDISRGLRYDGRLAEDFKLYTGTWVNFANLRGGFIAEAAPIVREVVLTGHDNAWVGALLFLDVEQAQKMDPSLASLGEAELAQNPLVRDHIQQALNRFLAKSTGSSTRIQRVMILQEPASIQNGEMTDKGSVNQRSVLARRKDLVEILYSDTPDERVLSAQKS